MPELPEVETVRMQLTKYIIGKTVIGIKTLHPKSLIGMTGLVTGKKVISVKRYGKMLVLQLSGEMCIGIHLKMSGQLIYVKKSKININNLHKHTRVVMTFNNLDELRFVDQRIFGWVRIMKNEEMNNLQFIKKLGKEPWDISDEDFFQKMHNRNRPVKLVILDQEVISGVGNIYANDALWLAGIDPGKKAKILRYEDTLTLRASIIKVLKEGIKLGGSTGRDGKYIDLEGNPGYYQENFKVYEREGKPCLRKDRGVIRKIKLGGRGTYFCPVCQK